jgi:hypothetical protein
MLRQYKAHYVDGLKTPDTYTSAVHLLEWKRPRLETLLVYSVPRGPNPSHGNGGTLEAYFGC